MDGRNESSTSFGLMRWNSEADMPRGRHLAIPRVMKNDMAFIGNFCSLGELMKARCSLRRNSNQDVHELI
jgi:hypothetical protein